MRKSPYAGLALHHRMPKAPRHTPPRQDCAGMQKPPRKPRSTASLGDMMRQCNRDAWDKTYRAQVTSECWEDECQEFTFMDLPRKTRFVRHAVATLLLLPLALITAMSLSRPARPRFRQSQHPLLHPRMVRPDGGGRVGGAGQQQAVHLIPAVPVRAGP